jgi:hypothetical protein
MAFGFINILVRYGHICALEHIWLATRILPDMLPMIQCVFCVVMSCSRQYVQRSFNPLRQFIRCERLYTISADYSITGVQDPNTVHGGRHNSEYSLLHVHTLLSEILKTESFFTEVVRTPKLAFGPNMPRRDTRSTHTTRVCWVQTLESRPAVAPSWLRQSARCNVPYCIHLYRWTA